MSSASQSLSEEDDSRFQQEMQQAMAASLADKGATPPPPPPQPLPHPTPAMHGTGPRTSKSSKGASPPLPSPPCHPLPHSTPVTVQRRSSHVQDQKGMGYACLTLCHVHIFWSGISPYPFANPSSTPQHPGKPPCTTGAPPPKGAQSQETSSSCKATGQHSQQGILSCHQVTASCSGDHC